MRVEEIIEKNREEIKNFPSFVDDEGYEEGNDEGALKGLKSDLELLDAPATPEILFRIYKDILPLLPEAQGRHLTPIAKMFIFRLVGGNYETAENLYDAAHEYVLAEKAKGYTGTMSQQDAVNFTNSFCSACSTVMWKLG